MQLCLTCGAENPEVARFCLLCGSSLAAAEAPAVERRIVTVIFVDLVGFTSRAERLDPEDVRAVLEPYHQRVRREIESFGGVVEKFIGDAVMGLFGAPFAHGDDAERAVRAALVIRDAVGEIAGGDLQIRVAVNTGEAVVSLGARPALGESMVAGDVVNTAARLQAAAPVNGVVVGAETYRETREAIAYEAAEPVLAKGKEHPVQAWTAVRPRTKAGERPLAISAIVGRECELAILRAFWELATSERLPHLVSMFGPAGVGKSTLLGEFARLAEENGARVVRGRSLPYREAGAYGSLATQLMQLSGVFESDAAEVVAAKLRVRAKSLLAGRDGDPGHVATHLGAIVGLDADSDAPDRESLFASARLFLESAAREQPTILVFEDIHWADANLLDFIEAFAARVRDLPLLLVTLSRPELLDTRPGWAAGLSAYTALTVPRLGDEDARELAARKLGDADGLDEVIRVAEGNPLFIEQLAAAIDETASGSLPTSVRALVAARLDALPRPERAVLIDAAVVGKVFWSGAVAAIRSEEVDLSAVLEELERRDLVRREDRSIMEGQEQFTFTHLLIRDVAYDLLPRADRARRHARIAEFFESSTGVSNEAIGAIARHWRDAGDYQRAVDQFVRAAAQAERGWAKNHAVLLYRQALELVPPEDEERRSFIRRRLAIAAQASFHLGDVRRAGSQPA
jgi:class 3 adenylate cyclase